MWTLSRDSSRTYQSLNHRYLRRSQNLTSFKVKDCFCRILPIVFPIRTLLSSIAQVDEEYSNMPPNLDTLDGRQLVLRNAISYFAVFLKDFRHPVSKRSAFQHEVLRYARDPHISEDFKRSIRSAADEIFSGKHRSEGNDDLDPDLPIHAAWSPAGPEDRAVFELCFLQVPHPDEPWYKSLQGTDWQRPLMLVGRALEMHLHTLSEQVSLCLDIF